MRETLERRLAAERPHGAYDDTHAGHDAFSRGLVDDYDHGNHHLARAIIRPANPGLVTRAGLAALGLPDTDATIIDELAQASDPNSLTRVLADAALLNLDRYATGAGLLYSRVGTALMLTAPNEQRLADAIDAVAASSKTRPVTVDARAIPSIKSGFFCAPRATGSLRAKRNASVRPSWQMRRISVSTSPTFTGQVREVFHQDTPAQGRRLAARFVERLPACPIPEIARLGANPTQVEGRLLGLLRHRRSQQRLHGSHQRTLSSHYRAGQTNRQRLPQPHQLPTPNAPHHRRPRRLHPHPTLKSRLMHLLALGAF